MKNEELFKQLVYNVTRSATAQTLNLVDAMATSGDTRIDDLKKYDSLKSAMRSIIMNFQREMLYGIKVILEHGELPEPIDKRNVHDKSENKSDGKTKAT